MKNPHITFDPSICIPPRKSKLHSVSGITAHELLKPHAFIYSPKTSLNVSPYDIGDNSPFYPSIDLADNRFPENDNQEQTPDHKISFDIDQELPDTSFNQPRNPNSDSAFISDGNFKRPSTGFRAFQQSKPIPTSKFASNPTRPTNKRLLPIPNNQMSNSRNIYQSPYATKSTFKSETNSRFSYFDRSNKFDLPRQTEIHYLTRPSSKKRTTSSIATYQFHKNYARPPIYQ